MPQPVLLWPALMVPKTSIFIRKAFYNWGRMGQLGSHGRPHHFKPSMGCCHSDGGISKIAFGLLQMIVCVIADCLADDRDRNTKQRSRERKHREIQEKQTLSNLFARVDTDGDGLVILGEMAQCASSLTEFAALLCVVYNITARFS